MVLIASSSVFPYGMMGRSVDGEKIGRREDVCDVLVFRFCSYSGVLAVMPASLTTPEWTF
jgi:hypothetical protein